MSIEKVSFSGRRLKSNGAGVNYCFIQYFHKKDGRLIFIMVVLVIPKSVPQKVAGIRGQIKYSVSLLSIKAMVGLSNVKYCFSKSL